jgi:dTDP-glucose 4,6-dehydratase
MEISMAKILITGVCGTVGMQLADELRRRKHDVWGCDLLHRGFENYCRADVRSYRQLERVFEQSYDYVYHLAAEFGRLNGEEYYDTLWETNVVGTRNILELQRKHQFKLIFASSSEIYGDSPIDILREELPMERPLLQHNDYAISKWVNEIQCMNFEKRYDSPIVRLRFFNAYGPGEYYHSYRSVVCLFCYRALHDIPYTVFKNYKRVFMYIDDFAPTLANVVDRFKPGGLYNIGGTEFRSVEELSAIILKQLGLDDRLVTYLPEDKHNIQNKRPDVARAIEVLGHTLTVNLEDGIGRTLDWMKKVYAPTIRH